jgi:PKD repeat protein
VLPISPGGSVDIGVDVTLGEGEHTFTIVLDPMDQVQETNEVNNVASRSVRVYEPGKLLADAGPDQAVAAGKVLYLDATGTVYLGDGVLSYEWDLGDGSDPLYGLYVEHVYQRAGAFTVAVRVSDGTIEDSDTCRVTVRERDDPPRAVIDPPGPVSADRLEPLVLSAELSTDDHGVRNATWDMGDGTILEGMSVSHRYAMHGVYVVKLTVFDTSEQFDINRTTVEVVNLLPEITALDGPRKAKVGKVVPFSVTTQDRDGSISTVGWDFDARDGIVFEVEGTEVSHVFKRKGNYNVTCIVRDNDGGQSVAHLEVKVEEEGSGSAIPGPGVTIALATLMLAAIIIVRRARGHVNKVPYQSGYNSP